MRISVDDEPFSETLNRLMGNAVDYDDRGFVITVAAYIDNALNQLIQLRLIDCAAAKELTNGASSAFGTFSARIKLARAIGCITEVEYKDINVIRKLRNDAAHRWDDFSLDHAAEKDRVDSLCSPSLARLPANSSREKLRNRMVDLLVWYELLRLESGKVTPDERVILPRIDEQNIVYQVMTDDPWKP